MYLGLPDQDYEVLKTNVSMEPGVTFALAVSKARDFAMHKGLERGRGGTDLPWFMKAFVDDQQCCIGLSFVHRASRGAKRCGAL